MSRPLVDPADADAAHGPSIIAALLSEQAGRRTAFHCHARGQLLGATHGVLSIGTESGYWVVPATHAVWMPPHRPHALQAHGAFDGWSVYVAEAACDTLPAQPCTLMVSSLLRAAVMRAASWHTRTLDAAQARVAEVLLDEIRALPDSGFYLPLPRDPRLIRIAQAMIQQLDDTRGVQAWAAWAGISTRTLIRKFPLETGLSVSAWRTQARLMRALEMLAARVSVTTIALDLGYESPSAFIAMFKRIYGVTPARFDAGAASAAGG